MARKKYKFTNKKHSRQGIISSVLGLLALLILAGSFAMAYMQSGQAGKVIAIGGLLAMLLTLGGLYYGIQGSRQEDVYRLFPRLGFGLNCILLVLFILIYVIGW